MAPGRRARLDWSHAGPADAPSHDKRHGPEPAKGGEATFSAPPGGFPHDRWGLGPPRSPSGRKSGFSNGSEAARGPRRVSKAVWEEIRDRGSHSAGHFIVDLADVELVRQAQAGEIGAFDALVQRYYAVCLRFAWHQLGSREDAEEVVQDAFLRAYRSLHGCQEPARFRGWLFTIVINRCRTFAARNRRRALLFNRWREREVIDPVPEASLPGRLDGNKEIERLMAGLSPVLREAFLLKHVEELTYEEMADATGVSVSALKMRVKRAADALSAQWKNETHV